MKFIWGGLLVKSYPTGMRILRIWSLNGHAQFDTDDQINWDKGCEQGG